MFFIDILSCFVYQSLLYMIIEDSVNMLFISKQIIDKLMDESIAENPDKYFYIYNVKLLNVNTDFNYN